MPAASAALLGIALAVTAAAPAPAAAGSPAITALSSRADLVDAQTLVPHLLVTLKYATDDNFIRRNVYGDLRRCFLQRDAAAMLAQAAAELNQRAPDLRLLAYDCARPRSVQLQMWQVVKGTPQQQYVANPHSKTGSIHNYGCAIDLTLSDAVGKALDLGTPFDFFGETAEPRHEARLLEAAALDHAALANRLLLREVMVRAGFYPLAHEWWHFNCATAAQTRKRYHIVE